MCLKTVNLGENIVNSGGHIHFLGANIVKNGGVFRVFSAILDNNA